MLLQIKECLSRNLDPVEIAHRLHLSLDYVNQAIEFLSTLDRKSTRLNSSHIPLSRMPSSA